MKVSATSPFLLLLLLSFITRRSQDLFFTSVSRWYRTYQSFFLHPFSPHSVSTPTWYGIVSEDLLGHGMIGFTQYIQCEWPPKVLLAPPLMVLILPYPKKNLFLMFFFLRLLISQTFFHNCSTPHTPHTSFPPRPYTQIRCNIIICATNCL